MTITITWMHYWRPAELVASAKALENQSTQLVELVREFGNGSDLAAAWNSPAGSRAHQVAQEMGNRIERASRSLSGAAMALRRVATEEQRLLDDLRTVEAAVQSLGNQWGLNPNGTLHAAPQPVFDPKELAGGLARNELTDWQNTFNTGQGLAASAQQILASADALDKGATGRISNASTSPGSSPYFISNTLAILNGQVPLNVNLALKMTEKLMETANSTGPFEGPLSDALYQYLCSLSPQELAMYIQMMPPDTAAAWAQAATRQFGYDNGQQGAQHPPSASFLKLMNYVLANVDTGTLDAVTDKLPFFSPSLQIGNSKYYYSSHLYPTPVFGPDGTPNPTLDISQGSLGDCYVLATLSTTAAHDPEWIRQHIKSNPNGTFTVTLFNPDGTAHEVVVSGDVPVNQQGDKANKAITGQWATIYEKALAQSLGGYSAINYGGTVPSALKMIYGNSVAVYVMNTDTVSFDDLKHRVDQGELVAGGSTERPELKTIPGSHAFSIVSVDDKAHTVTVQNPWGSSDQAPQFVTLTWDEFKKNFIQIQGGVKGG